MLKLWFGADELYAVASEGVAVGDKGPVRETVAATEILTFAPDATRSDVWRAFASWLDTYVAGLVAAEVARLRERDLTDDERVCELAKVRSSLAQQCGALQERFAAIVDLVYTPDAARAPWLM